MTTNTIFEYVSKVLEEEILKKDPIVIYSGRFQPFHPGHYSVYKHLVDKFGKSNVWVATSDKVNYPESPLSFSEKKKIATTLFDIPTGRFIQTKSPYSPKEILNKYNPETTYAIFVVGDKDSERLSKGGKYFTEWVPNIDHEGHDKRGYVYSAPPLVTTFSGTKLRDRITNADLNGAKKYLSSVYGTKNDAIFTLIYNKIGGKVIPKEFLEEWVVNNLKFINEASVSGGKSEVDDGPNFLYPDYSTFYKHSEDRARDIGYQVVKQISYGFFDDIPMHRIYPDGPIPSVSYFPSGVAGERTPNSQIQDPSVTATKKWLDLVKDMSTKIGYKILDDFEYGYMDSKVPILTNKEPISEKISIQNLRKIDKYGDAVLAPINLDLSSRHFFERLNDPRNLKDITEKELISFIDKIGENKEQFLQFLRKYREIVTTDKRSSINIPFMIKANKAIAKTIMRKRGFRTSNPILTFEQKEYNKLDYYKTYIENIVPSNFDVEVVDNRIMVSIPSLSLSEDRDYKKEYEEYHSRPEQKKRRAQRNSARRKLLKSGKVKKGDGKDVHHRNHDTSDNSSKNLVAIPKSKNRAKNRKESVELIPDMDENLMIGYPDAEWYKRHSRKLKALRPKLKATHPVDKGYEPINNIRESFLLEGGSYGHLAHPYEYDSGLTFSDMKTIVKKSLTGTLELAREKTDGMALAVSWKNNKLIAARNKGHLKNYGEDALDIKGVEAKFQNRGGLSDAYNFAMKDLSDAISSLPKDKRDEIFKEGKCFMNLEVIWPESVNVIPYGQSLLVFHGTFEYDINGNVIGENDTAATTLFKLIKGVNKDVQEHFTIQGPPLLELPKRQDLSDKQPYYLGQISKLQREFSLSDNSTVLDYAYAWWNNYLKTNHTEIYESPYLPKLLDRWIQGDKKFMLKSIDDKVVQKLATDLEKGKLTKLQKLSTSKFEELFLKLGSDILKFTTSILTANPDKAVQQIKSRLEATIKAVEGSADPSKIEKLRYELDRLNRVGGMDYIVPNEGIVFKYPSGPNGKVYKLTGNFAPLNQILGMFYDTK